MTDGVTVTTLSTNPLQKIRAATDNNTKSHQTENYRINLRSDINF